MELLTPSITECISVSITIFDRVWSSVNLELLSPVARYGEWIVVDRRKFVIFVDFLPFANWMFDLLLKKFDVEIWWIRFTVLKERWSNCIAYRLAYPGSCGIMLHLLSSRAVNCWRLASLNVKKRTKNHPKYVRWTGIGEKVVEIPQFWGGQDCKWVDHYTES